jgi:hypothetical protein
MSALCRHALLLPESQASFPCSSVGVFPSFTPLLIEFTIRSPSTVVWGARKWSTGPLIAVGNSKKYRVVGEFAIKRGTSGSEDDFQIRIASPDNGTYVACAIECLDCPATTTGVPQYKEDTGTNVDFTVIDPDGNMEGTVYHYRIEGIFKTDADGAGNVRLTFNKNGGAPTTTMMANSYWARIEIN